MHKFVSHDFKDVSQNILDKYQATLEQNLGKIQDVLAI